jgi:mycoredoxin
MDQQAGSERHGQEILMYTTTWCSDCRRAKKVFAARGVPYTEINIEEEPEAAEQVKRLNNGMQSVPTIVFADGSILVEPSNPVLEAKLASLAAR